MRSQPFSVRGGCENDVPCTQSMPGSVYVRVEVFLGGLACADSISRVVVGEDVAVDSSAEADVEAAHLAEVDSVAMGEENGESEERGGFKGNDG